MAAPGYYVVWVGVKAGVYDNWQECLNNTHGYPHAKHKKFNTRAEAEQAFIDGPGDYYKRGNMNNDQDGDKVGFDLAEFLTPVATPVATPEIIDGTCPVETLLCVHVDVDRKTGYMSYVYDWDNGYGDKKLHRYSEPCPFPKLSQNLAEFDALVKGLAFLKMTSRPFPIYSTSDVALAWVAEGAIYGPDLVAVNSNPDLSKWFNRRCGWLILNRNHNSARKWNVRDWGKSPAASNKGYTL